MKEIRLLTKDDLDACVALCDECFAETNYSYDVRKDLIQMFIDDSISESEFFVFDNNGVIEGLIGFSNCMFDSSVYGIYCWYVKPASRNKNIGPKLGRHVLSRLEEKEAETVMMSTRTPKILERIGFKQIVQNGEWSIMYKQLNKQ